MTQQWNNIPSQTRVKGSISNISLLGKDQEHFRNPESLLDAPNSLPSWSPCLIRVGETIPEEHSADHLSSVNRRTGAEPESACARWAMGPV